MKKNVLPRKSARVKRNKKQTKKVRSHRRAKKSMSGGSSNVGALLVHANWCGACQLTKPEWEKAAKKNKNITILEESSEDYDKVIVGIVKRFSLPSEMSAKLERKSITGYPTMFKISKGNVKSIDARTEEDVLKML